MRILLVEDHKFLAQVTMGVLREVHDHEVEHALSARQASELAAQQTYDLILIDLDLPDGNGYDLAAELRKNEALNSTVFVALTGIGNMIDEDRAIAAGIDACYTKPMNFDLLDTVKRRFLNQATKD